MAFMRVPRFLLQAVTKVYTSNMQCSGGEWLLKGLTSGSTSRQGTNPIFSPSGLGAQDGVRLMGAEVVTSLYTEMSWKTPASSLLDTVVITWW